MSSPEKVKTTQEGGKALKSAFHSNWGKAKQVLIQQPFSCVTSGHLLEQATVLFSQIHKAKDDNEGAASHIWVSFPVTDGKCSQAMVVSCL